MGLREAAPSGKPRRLDPVGAIRASTAACRRASREMKENGSALYSLLLVGFAYGIFHAAGPGHGKGVISAYLVADEKALRKGFALSLAAALVQALVAIAIVVIGEPRAARHRRHHEQARDERGIGELPRRRPARRASSPGARRASFWASWRLPAIPTPPSRRIATTSTCRRPRNSAA